MAMRDQIKRYAQKAGFPLAIPHLTEIANLDNVEIIFSSSKRYCAFHDCNKYKFGVNFLKA